MATLGEGFRRHCGRTTGGHCWKIKIRALREILNKPRNRGHKQKVQ